MYVFCSSFNSGEYALAAELYREVLRSSEEHKEKLKTDSLQVSEHSNVKIKQLVVKNWNTSDLV